MNENIIRKDELQQIKRYKEPLEKISKYLRKEIIYKQFKCKICENLNEDSYNNFIISLCCKETYCLNCYNKDDEKCPFCKEVVKYINFESHCHKCLNKKIKCILCNKDLLLKELDSHLKTCDMALIECDKCHYKFNRKYYFEKHYLQNDCSKECLINQVEYWKNLSKKK